MAIAIGTTRQALANTYTGLGAYLGAATGDPGLSATPANEASGGSPAYIRKATSWTPGSGGTATGTPITLDVAAANYTFIILCGDAGGNTMIDKVGVSTVSLSGQGQLVITPSFAIA